MLGVFPASFASSTASAMWEAEESEATKLIGLYRRYSLLEHDETSGRYRLHDLLTDYALGEMEDEEKQEARYMHATHYKEILSASDDLYLEGGENILLGLKLFDLEWENIQTSQSWVAKNGKVSKEIARLCSNFTTRTHCVDLRLHPRQLLLWHKSALAADQFLGDRQAEGVALGNLGNAYAALGETRKAIEFYEQRMVIAREIGDRRGEAIGSWNLGQSYEKAEELEKAIKYMQICVDFEREIGHPDADADAKAIEEIRKRL
jgi:tetratricopeptide (TPR) repeat protein